MFMNQNAKRGKILIVDDEIDILATLKERLELNGLEVLTAEDGAKGLGKALGQTPDIIITDLMMPVMGGVAMIEELRKTEDGRNVPVIILTARNDRKDAVYFTKLGIADHITKPFEMSDLLGKIDEILESNNLMARKA